MVSIDGTSPAYYCFTCYNTWEYTTWKRAIDGARHHANKRDHVVMTSSLVFIRPDVRLNIG